MRKRIWTLLLVASIGVLCIGCGKKKEQANTQAESLTDSTKEEVTTTEEAASTELEVAVPDKDNVSGRIVVLTDSTTLVNTKYAEYKRTFENKYPGTEVIFQPYKNYNLSVMELMESGDYGDVLLIPESISQDELSEYFDPLGTIETLAEQYDIQYLESYQQEGVVYGIPRYVTPMGIAYNRRVFEQSGITQLPASPTEFIQTLQKIQDENEGIVPCYVNARQKNNLALWQDYVWESTTGNGEYRYTEFLEDSAPFSKDSPNYIVHKLLYDVVKNHLSGDQDISLRNAKGMLNRGEIACMAADWEMLSSLQKADTNMDDIGYMPFPYNIDGVQYTAVNVGEGYGINKNSQNKTTARAFINYMMNNSEFAYSIGAIPINIKKKYPKLLEQFQNVTLVIESIPTEEQKNVYKQKNKESGVLLDSGEGKSQLVKEAASSEENAKSFDEIMEEWNESWSGKK